MRYPKTITVSFGGEHRRGTIHAAKAADAIAAGLESVRAGDTLRFNAPVRIGTDFAEVREHLATTEAVLYFTHIEVPALTTRNPADEVLNACVQDALALRRQRAYAEKLACVTPVPLSLEDLAAHAFWLHATELDRLNPRCFAPGSLPPVRDADRFFAAHGLLFEPYSPHRPMTCALAKRLQQLHPEECGEDRWEFWLVHLLLRLEERGELTPDRPVELFLRLMDAAEWYPHQVFTAPSGFWPPKSPGEAEHDELSQHVRTLGRQRFTIGEKKVLKHEFTTKENAVAASRRPFEEGFVVAIYSTEETVQTETYLQGTGQRGGETWNLVIGKDEPSVNRFVELHRAEEHDAQATEEIGALLGYPPCCVRAFGELTFKNDITALARALGRTEGNASAELVMTAPFARIDYFPCSLDCPASLASAHAHRRDYPEGPEPRSMLLLFPHGRVYMGGAEPRPNGFDYTHVMTHQDFPRIRHLVELMQRGSEVIVLPRLLAVLAKGKVVATLPHDDVLPVPHGLPNPFDWLGDATYTSTSDFHVEPRPPERTHLLEESWRVLEAHTIDLLKSGFSLDLGAPRLTLDGAIELSRGDYVITVEPTTADEATDALAIARPAADVHLRISYRLLQDDAPEAEPTAKAKALARALTPPDYSSTFATLIEHLSASFPAAGSVWLLTSDADSAEATLRLEPRIGEVIVRLERAREGAKYRFSRDGLAMVHEAPQGNADVSWSEVLDWAFRTALDAWNEHDDPREQALASAKNALNNALRAADWTVLRSHPFRRGWSSDVRDARASFRFDVTPREDGERYFKATTDYGIVITELTENPDHTAVESLGKLLVRLLKAVEDGR